MKFTGSHVIRSVLAIDHDIPIDLPLFISGRSLIAEVTLIID